jgi:hypothetical protein
MPPPPAHSKRASLPFKSRQNEPPLSEKMVLADVRAGQRFRMEAFVDEDEDEDEEKDELVFFVRGTELGEDGEIWYHVVHEGESGYMEKVVAKDMADMISVSTFLGQV